MVYVHERSCKDGFISLLLEIYGTAGGFFFALTKSRVDREKISEF